MGRIKTTPIKRVTQKIFNQHKDSLKTDFEHNKQIVAELLKNTSKPIRNKIAGYATRLVQRSLNSTIRRPAPRKPAPRRDSRDGRDNRGNRR